MDLRIKIDGKTKKFSKKEFFIKDNIEALKFSVKQEEYLKKEKRTIEDIEKHQLDFAAFIAEVFEHEFTADEYVEGCLLDDKTVAENIYILCLGGKVDDEEKKDQK